MTDKEIAFKIAAAFRRFQARQTAYQVYLNRLPVDVQATEKSIDWDVNADLSPQGPYGPAPAIHSRANWNQPILTKFWDCCIGNCLIQRLTETLPSHGPSIIVSQVCYYPDK